MRIGELLSQSARIRPMLVIEPLRASGKVYLHKYMRDIFPVKQQTQQEKAIVRVFFRKTFPFFLNNCYVPFNDKRITILTV